MRKFKSISIEDPLKLNIIHNFQITVERILFDKYSETFKGSIQQFGINDKIKGKVISLIGRTMTRLSIFLGFVNQSLGRPSIESFYKKEFKSGSPITSTAQSFLDDNYYIFDNDTYLETLLESSGKLPTTNDMWDNLSEEVFSLVLEPTIWSAILSAWYNVGGNEKRNIKLYMTSPIVNSMFGRYAGLLLAENGTNPIAPNTISGSSEYTIQTTQIFGGSRKRNKVDFQNEIETVKSWLVNVRLDSKQGILKPLNKVT